MGIDLNSWIKAGLPPALTLEMDSRKTKDDCHIPPEIPQSVPPPPHPTSASVNSDRTELITSLDYPPPILELLGLLKKNPGVKIINTPTRYTVLRDGKYVGGRINELVFRTPEVLDYLTSHPAEEIDGTNLIIRKWRNL